MGRLARIMFLLALVGLIVSVGAGALFYKQWHGRGPLAVDATVVIENGTSVVTIGRQLEEAGVVEDFHLFVLGVHLFSGGRPLRAGEYKFGAGMSEEQVMRMLLSGATVARRITVPEGYTTAQIMRLVASAEGLVGELPPDPPSEGRLLPETYFYTRGETRFIMINRMADAMQQALQKLWAQRAADLPYDTIDKALVLASIVEKETSSPTERAHIAGVFVNRLRRGMPLQSDPTVIYAVTNGSGPLGRPINSADLQVKSPYNSYLFKGLPPGPICNPGLAAVQAVLHPLATKDLYFVADGSGGHAFAVTLAEHNKNVAAWRKIEALTPADQPGAGGTGTAIAADPAPAGGSEAAPAANSATSPAATPPPAANGSATPAAPPAGATTTGP
jgi:peptidoglycan lytic transglycosylase G